MTGLSETFDWFSRPIDERDESLQKAIPLQLVALWEEVRREVGAERFDQHLGRVRAGKFSRSDDTAWAQTNDEKEDGFVNLTLEIEAAELSLNLIGWFDPQLEKVEAWLRKPKAWRFLRERPDWSILIFIRKGSTGKSGPPVFKGAEGKVVERLDLFESSPVDITTRLSGLRPSLAPDEKLALHIRRGWNAAEVDDQMALVEQLANEVRDWLTPLGEIRVT